MQIRSSHAKQEVRVLNYRHFDRGGVSESGAAILSVRDIGLGIASEDLPHIFERFYRSDETRSSAAGCTGLGLAITKAIVEAHGGTIQVTSVLGNGSTFTVRLPGLSHPSESSTPPGIQ